MSSADNTIPIEAWNTVLFEKFFRFRDVLTNGLANHSDELLHRRPYEPGAYVLEVGCGFGEITRQIAAQVAASGSAVGVDCASNFIDLARLETRHSSFSNAHYFAADVQGDDLLGPYDHIFSRFGTMFFNLPGAAF